VFKLDLRQQRHGIDIAVFGRFFGPGFGLLIIARAVVGFGEVILRAAVARLSLLQVLAANLFGAHQGRKKDQ